MDYSIFRDRLQYLVSEKGLPNRVLSTQLGISAPTLSRYLSGDRKPELPYLLAISDYFNVSIDWLLGIEDGRERIKDEMHEIAHLFSISTPEDRTVVHAILDKYKTRSSYERTLPGVSGEPHTATYFRVASKGQDDSTFDAQREEVERFAQQVAPKPKEE